MQRRGLAHIPVHMYLHPFHGHSFENKAGVGKINILAFCFVKRQMEILFFFSAPRAKDKRAVGENRLPLILWCKQTLHSVMMNTPTDHGQKCYRKRNTETLRDRI